MLDIPQKCGIIKIQKEHRKQTEKQQEENRMKKGKMNTNQLRDYAVSLGADRKKLYGTSKQSLLIIISRLEKQNTEKEKTA